MQCYEGLCTGEDVAREPELRAAELHYIRCDWQYFSYHASQRHFKLRTHAIQAFEDALLPAGLCKRAHTHTHTETFVFRYPATNTQAIKKQGPSLWIQQAKTRVREVEEERVRGDGDKSGQTDLCLAHVGQRLFEMLWRSCGMARGQLARISKHKIGGEESYSTIAEGSIKCSKYIKKKSHCALTKRLTALRDWSHYKHKHFPDRTVVKRLTEVSCQTKAQ